MISHQEKDIGGGLDFSKYVVPKEEVIGRHVSDDSDPEAHGHATASTNWMSLSKGAVPETHHGLLSSDKEANNLVAIEEGPTDAQVSQKRRIFGPGKMLFLGLKRLIFGQQFNFPILDGRNPIDSTRRGGQLQLFRRSFEASRWVR